MLRTTGMGDRHAIHVETFLFAGSSALLLALVHLYPEFWFLSFFALVPFLWQAIRSDGGSSALSGLILAACYMFVVQPHGVWDDPSAWFLGLSILGSVFWLYGCAARWVYRRLGLNAMLVALIWLPAEYLISHPIDFTIFPVPSDGTGGIFFRIASLGGLLVLSFVVVLINLLILSAMDKLADALSGDLDPTKKKIKRRFAITSPLIKLGWPFLIPESRAPPSTTILWSDLTVRPVLEF